MPLTVRPFCGIHNGRTKRCPVWRKRRAGLGRRLWGDVECLNQQGEALVVSQVEVKL